MTLEDLHASASIAYVVWFVLLFVGIVVWAFWPSRKQALESQALIPLNDDRLPD